MSVSSDRLRMSSSSDDVVHTDTELLELPDEVEVYEIEGPFFFGTAAGFEEHMEKALRREPKNEARVCILRMRFVPFMDSTAVYNLSELYQNLNKRKTRLILSGVNPNVKETLEKSGLEELIGSEYVCTDIHRALIVANKYITDYNTRDENR